MDFNGSNINGADYLRVMEENGCLIVWEKSPPWGSSKREFISLRAQNGQAVRFEQPIQTSYIEVPHQCLDGFLRDGLVEELDRDDENGKARYTLTNAGKKAARSF